MVIAFHPALSLDKILIQRSYCHSQNELTSIKYLSREQLQFKPTDLIKQLYDTALLVSKRIYKNALAQCFALKLPLLKKTLLSWFNRKFTSQFKELNSVRKIKYTQENPINYQNDKCVVCKMPIRISPSNPKTSDPDMAYGDFIIRYEYKFLKNIYTQEQLEWSPDLVNLE